MKINNRSPITLKYSACITEVSYRLKPETLLPCLKVLLIALPLLLFSCAGTQSRKSLFTTEKSISSMLVDRLDRFEATGDIAISYRGERHRGKMFVSIKDGDNFICDFYTPFAQIIASFISGKDSAEIIIGEHEYRIGINDHLSFVPFLSQYPFIFNDFIRILSGRVYKSECFSLEVDTIRIEGRRKTYEWISDSVKISVTVSGNGKKIKSVSCSTLGEPRWKLEYSSFKGGISRKIDFKSGEKNYFSLVFERIRL